MSNKSLNSLLVSFKGADSSSLESDIHINLWKMSSEKYFLDLGLMFYSIKCDNPILDPIQLFLPFKIDKSKISDLGRTINSVESISTVFNEKLKTESGPDKSSMTKCYNENNSLSFYIFELGEINYTIEEIKGIDGSFLTITIPIPEALQGVDFNLYIRFRITINTSESIKFLKHDEHISNNILQAAFSRMELYDFRLNDIRNTDDKVYQKLVSEKYRLVSMRKVHFFFMADAKDHVSNGNGERMDTRMLEIEKWKDYLNEDMNHAFIAYHWKKKREKLSCTPKKDISQYEDEIKKLANSQDKEEIAGIIKTMLEKDDIEEYKEISSFEVFFRDTCNNINKRLMFSYLFFLFAVGMTGSLLSSIDITAQINWSAIKCNALLYLLFALFAFGKEFALFLIKKLK